MEKVSERRIAVGEKNINCIDGRIRSKALKLSIQRRRKKLTCLGPPHSCVNILSSAEEFVFIFILFFLSTRKEENISSRRELRRGCSKQWIFFGRLQLFPPSALCASLISSLICELDAAPCSASKARLFSLSPMSEAFKLRAKDVATLQFLFFYFLSLSTYFYKIFLFTFVDS